MFMVKMLRTELALLLCLSLLMMGGCAPSSEPAACYHVPEAYTALLTHYEAVAEGLRSKSFEQDYHDGIALFDSPDEALLYEWCCMLIAAGQYAQAADQNTFGYILEDINNDTVPELFWVQGDYTVLAVFTLEQDTPKLLDAYWPKHTCRVLDSGELYVRDTGGAAVFAYTWYTLDTQTRSLTPQPYRFGCDDGANFETPNGERISINETRFAQILSEHPFEHGERWYSKHICTQ